MNSKQANIQSGKVLKKKVLVHNKDINNFTVDSIKADGHLRITKLTYISITEQIPNHTENPLLF